MPPTISVTVGSDAVCADLADAVALTAATEPPAAIAATAIALAMRFVFTVSPPSESWFVRDDSSACALRHRGVGLRWRAPPQHALLQCRYQALCGQGDRSDENHPCEDAVGLEVVHGGLDQQAEARRRPQQ